MSTTESGPYQMLWDCPRCGTHELLGLDHRHCPGCGAPQDPSLRYFPADEDKVAAENHVFAGADRACPYCETANGARSTFCGSCGAALDGSAGPVQTRAEVATRAGEAFAGETAADAKADLGGRAEAARAARERADAAPEKKSRKGCVIGCVVLLVLGAIAAVLVVVAATWRQDSTLAVTGHRWERSIQIETYGPAADEAWCDQLPSGAYDVRKHDKQRSTKKIEDGEECTTRRVDQGDGSFKEVTDCVPRYREEPVYDEHCTFRVDRWSAGRVVRAEGASLGEAPAWPAAALVRTGTCEGCEREGERSEQYVVTLADDDGERHDCAMDEARWRTFAVGARYRGEVGVLTGSLDCDGLAPAGG